VRVCWGTPPQGGRGQVPARRNLQGLPLGEASGGTKEGGKRFLRELYKQTTGHLNERKLNIGTTSSDPTGRVGRGEGEIGGFGGPGAPGTAKFWSHRLGTPSVRGGSGSGQGPRLPDLDGGLDDRALGVGDKPGKPGGVSGRGGTTVHGRPANGRRQAWISHETGPEYGACPGEPSCVRDPTSGGGERGANFRLVGTIHHESQGQYRGGGNGREHNEPGSGGTPGTVGTSIAFDKLQARLV